MSKYDSLWMYIKNRDNPSVQLSFDEIKNISGIAIDHSFLNYKKELLPYGFHVEKISLEEKWVLFQKISSLECNTIRSCE